MHHNEVLIISKSTSVESTLPIAFSALEAGVFGVDIRTIRDSREHET
jgi:hypothetical protein